MRFELYQSVYENHSSIRPTKSTPSTRCCFCTASSRIGFCARQSRQKCLPGRHHRDVAENGRKFSRSAEAAVDHSICRASKMPSERKKLSLTPAQIEPMSAALASTAITTTTIADSRAANSAIRCRHRHRRSRWRRRQRRERHRCTHRNRCHKSSQRPTSEAVPSMCSSSGHAAIYAPHAAVDVRRRNRCHWTLNAALRYRRIFSGSSNSKVLLALR